METEVAAATKTTLSLTYHKESNDAISLAEKPVPNVKPEEKEIIPETHGRKSQAEKPIV